jgi:glycogen debranching enzyme
VISRYEVQTHLGPVSLASDETLVNIVRSEIALPRDPEDPLDALLRMASVTRAEDLGTAGPVVASLASKENAANPEVRRYEAKFGRDAFYTAAFLADLYPALEAGTVRYFAAYQGTATDPRSMSEPGKIAHHIRHPDDPIARRLTADSGRRWPWFGSTDTTVLFLLAACRVVDRDPAALDATVYYPSDHAEAGRAAVRGERLLTLGRVIRDAAVWLLHQLDRPAAHGLLWAGLNRKDSFTVWTDSPNSFHHRDGQLARPPIAPVQLQAEVYDSLVALSQLVTRRPEVDLDAGPVLARTRRIRDQLLTNFVVDGKSGPYLANGLAIGYSGRLKPLAVRTIGMGMALDSGVLAGEDTRPLRDSLVRHLFSAEMSSPFGIVGRARDEVRFEPFDYHSQVWAFAVYRTALGLCRHGYADLARELCHRVLEQTRDGLLPENVGAGQGDELRYCPHILTVRRPAADGRMTVTVKERTPAPIAAWTAGAVLAMTHR